jgi:hypothetical protein
MAANPLSNVDRMTNNSAVKVSGYLSIFDDWDILPEALKSIDPFVDEIVVVDGAYDWIAPFLDGRDGKRSRDEVYDALAPYSGKIRVIQQTWTDEVQKRMAGFEACAGRWILRHDADEVFFASDDALERALADETKPVSEIDMPIFVTPERMLSSPAVDPQRQGALFDSKRIGSEAHLSYLWLVLPKHLKPGPPDHSLIVREPFAFVAHLTSWRTPTTANNRALFYSLLYIRNGGLYPLDINEPGPRAQMREILGGHNIVSGPLRTDNNICAPTPLNDAQRASLKPIYDRYLAAHERKNRAVANGTLVINSGDYSFDVTTVQNAQALGDRFYFDADLTEFSARLASVHIEGETARTRDLKVDITGAVAAVELPPFEPNLQSTLVIKARTAGGPVVRFATAPF